MAYLIDLKKLCSKLIGSTVFPNFDLELGILGKLSMKCERDRESMSVCVCVHMQVRVCVCVCVFHILHFSFGHIPYIIMTRNIFEETGVFEEGFRIC